MMKRRVVPFVPVLPYGKDQSGAAADQLNKLIEQQASDGWTYSHLDSFSEVSQPGCLGGLLGHKAQLISVRLAVFEREG